MRSCAVNRQSWRSTEGAIFNCQLHLPLVVDRTSFTIFFKINTHTCYTTQLPECMNNYMSPEYMNLQDPVAPMNLYGTLTHERGFPSSWPWVWVARILVTHDFPTQNVTCSCWNEEHQWGKKWWTWKFLHNFFFTSTFTQSNIPNYMAPTRCSMKATPQGSADIDEQPDDQPLSDKNLKVKKQGHNFTNTEDVQGKKAWSLS